MRIPVKSERDAFRLTYGAVAVIAAAGALGALTAPLAGVGLLAAVVLAAVVWDVTYRDPERPAPLREAARAGRRAAGGGGARVLVVANETVVGQELRDHLLGRPQPAEVRVVCPILPSRAHLVTSDIDRELAEARERLELTLGWARAQGIEMTGRVSESTPVTAVADELRTFAADEVIVSTHPPARSRWLESGLVERLRGELDIPVTHVVIDLGRRPQPAGPRHSMA